MVNHLYPQAQGSLFVASYDSQGYSGGIQTHLHTDTPESRVTFRLAVYRQSVPLGAKPLDALRLTP
jgi:hypothetical protein